MVRYKDNKHIIKSNNQPLCFPAYCHHMHITPSGYPGGIALQLMDFAEQYGRDTGYTTVWLDAYSPNKRVLKFYESRDIKTAALFTFPAGSMIFIVMKRCCS